MAVMQLRYSKIKIQNSIFSSLCLQAIPLAGRSPINHSRPLVNTNNWELRRSQFEDLFVAKHNSTRLRSIPRGT